MVDYRVKIRRFLFQEFIPVTKTIALLAGIIFLLQFLFGAFRVFNVSDFLLLDGQRFYLKPWTLLTYPLINGDFFSLLFGVLWLWYIGGSLERTWGSRAFAVFFVLVTGLTGLMMALVLKFFLNDGVAVYDLWLPLVGLTWAWSLLYPDQEMLFWGIVPIQARWLAWITAAIVFFNYLAKAPMGIGWLLALASLTGIPVAHMFFTRPFSGGRGRYNRWSKEISSNSWRSDSKKKPVRKRLRLIK